MAMNPLREVHSAGWGQRQRSAQWGLDRVDGGVLGHRAACILKDLGGSKERPWGPLCPLGMYAKQAVILEGSRRTSGQGRPLGGSLVWNGLSRLGFQVWR